MIAKTAIRGVRQGLAGLRIDAKGGGQRYRVLLPKSETPVPRLNNFVARLRNYRAFRDAEASAAPSQADRIRAFALAEYVRPARARGDTQVTIVSGDVDRAMGLQDAMPSVCSALGRPAFEELAGARLAAREGPENSSTVRFTFDLSPKPVGCPRLRPDGSSELFRCGRFWQPQSFRSTRHGEG